jgi:predicted DNA binding CopG/RHH family protein
MVEKNKKFLMEMPSPLHKELKMKSAATGIPMKKILEEIIEKEMAKRNDTHVQKLRRRNRK